MAQQNSKQSGQTPGKPGKRLLAITVGAFCLSCAVGGVYVIRQRHISGRYLTLRQEGLTAYATGHSGEAVKDLLPYLQRYPNDPVALSAFARARLASSSNGAGNSDAIVALRSVIKNDPSRTDDGRLLLSLYLQAGYFTEAVDTADTIIAHAGSDATVVGERVQALMGLQRWDEAQQGTRRWVELAPDDLDAHMSVLTIMRQQQQPPAEIIAAGDALFKNHPKDLRYRFLRGYAHSLGGDSATATDDFKAVSASIPVDDEHFAQALVSQLDQVGLYDESLSVLVRSYAAKQSSASLDRLARRYWDAGKIDDLTQLLGKAPAEQVQSSNDLLALKSLALLQAKRPTDAATSINLLHQRKDDPVAAAWSLVLDQMSSGSVSSVDASKKVVDACTAALAHSSSLPYLSFFLGDAYSRLNDNELAVSSWERAAQEERAWAIPLIRAAEVLASEGRDQSALASANEAVKRSPRSPAAVIMLARVWATCVDKGQYGHSDQLLNLVTQIQTQMPNEEQTLPIRIKLLANSGRVSEAKSLLNSALSGNTPISQSTLMQLAALSDDWSMDLRDQCFQKAERENGMTPGLAYVQAMSLFNAGKADAGLALIKQDRASADPKGESVDWRITQARYLDQIGSPQARGELVSLGNAFPNDSRVQRMIISSTGAWQDRDFMDQTINRFRTLTGERGALWRIARGRWMLTYSNDPQQTQEAINLLTAATQLAPDMADPHVLLARAQERAGKLDLALEQLTIASQLEPNSDSISLSMARLLQAQGNFDAARDRLDRVVAGPMHGSQQRQQAALLFAQEGEFQQAIDLLRDSVDQGGGDEQGYLLLAKLYQQRHEPEKAEAICKKLMEKPDAATVQFAAELMANQGRMSDADAILKHLDTLHLEPGMRELILADFAMRHRSPADALQNYQAAVGAAPKNQLAWMALLSFKLAGGDISGSRATLDSALAQLPQDTTLGAINKHWDAIQSINVSPDLRPMALTFIRNPRESTAAFEVLQAASQNKSNYTAAQQLVDSVVTVARKYPQDVSVQNLLCRLYQRVGRAEDAIIAARRAAELAPASPEAFELLTESNMQAGRWTEALDAAKQWKERVSGSLVAPDLAIASCQIQLSQPGVALTQLEPYMSDPSAPVYSQVLPTYARAKEMVQKSSAAKLMEPLLSQGAQGRREWIEFAVHNIADSEAAAWLDRAALKIPDDAYDEKLELAQGWLQLSVRAHSDAYTQKGKALLENVVAQPHPSSQAMLLLAMLDEHANDSQAAETLYRRVIATDPDPAIAKNNLAMILYHRGQNLDEAEALSNAALKAHPEVPAFYDTAAAVELAQKHYADAIGNQESAVQKQPNNLSYQLHLAVCLADAGRSGRAAEVLKDLDDHRADLDHLPSDDQAKLAALRKQLSSKSSSSNGVATGEQIPS